MATKLVMQKHHHAYQDYNKKEWISTIYRHEHYHLTKLNRISKNISRGFLDALELYILRNRHLAIDLDKLVEVTKDEKEK